MHLAPRTSDWNMTDRLRILDSLRGCGVHYRRRSKAAVLVRIPCTRNVKLMEDYTEIGSCEWLLTCSNKPAILRHCDFTFDNTAIEDKHKACSLLHLPATRLFIIADLNKVFQRTSRS